MDPLGIVGILFVGYLLLSKNAAPASATAGTAAAPSSALSSIQQALASLQKSLQQQSQSKPSSGSASGGTGSPSSAGKATDPSTHSNTSVPSFYTDQSTIDALTNNGGSDAQVAAYLAALNEGDTTLADAIIGDVAPQLLENDPNTDSTGLGDIQPVDIAPYDPPAMTYTPPDAAGSDSSYGDSVGNAGIDVPYIGGGDYGDLPVDDGSTDYGDGGDGGGD